MQYIQANLTLLDLWTYGQEENLKKKEKNIHSLDFSIWTTARWQQEALGKVLPSTTSTVLVFLVLCIFYQGVIDATNFLKKFALTWKSPVSNERQMGRLKIPSEARPSRRYHRVSLSPTQILLRPVTVPFLPSLNFSVPAARVLHTLRSPKVAQNSL